jgi:methylmalonyl-CoA mutase cobalamin-binding domain/chain
LCIRRLGARELEQRFGPGTFDASLINSRQPLLVSENMKALQEVGKRALQALSRQQQIVIQKRKLTAAIATSDVHEYGKIVLEQTLRDLDVEVCDAGTSTDPSTVVQVACDTDADFIALSTYNGIALTYLQALRDEMRRSGLDIPVFVGGRMNQIPEGSNTSLPVDVTSKVSALGMTVCSDVGEMLNQLSRDS